MLQELQKKKLMKKVSLLMNRGRYLIFKVRTANYILTINALDGTIMEKEKNKEKK